MLHLLGGNLRKPSHPHTSVIPPPVAHSPRIVIPAKLVHAEAGSGNPSQESLEGRVKPVRKKRRLFRGTNPNSIENKGQLEEQTHPKLLGKPIEIE